MHLRSILIATSLLALALGAPGRAVAVTPTEELRRYTDQVIRVLQDPTLTPGVRRAAVRDVAEEAFDVAETARRALGPHWQQRTAAERDAFVRVFHDLLEQTYLPRVDDYQGEWVRFVSERREGDHAIVRALVVTRLAIPVAVETRLVRKGDRWQIYDVLIEKMSLVAGYRAQFDRVIRASSYEDLLHRLKARVERLAHANGQRTAEPAGR
jgi:phospholipid transport system substrate-binding protein